ncbi:MAG: carboxypeptidase-like regulatory domain-containing protein [Bacteroidales bacterium]|nr:carboxypeptidase-like regulatory domain-containing protein [Bacteroidales bacterium]
MKLFKIILTVISLHSFGVVFAQSVVVRGHIADVQGNNLLATNVYLLHCHTVGTVANINGDFTLKIANPEIIRNEYLVFSLIGYETVKIYFDSIDITKPVQITLTENTQTLHEVVVMGRKSISREFSMKEMDKLKIYLSPLASADPLKAIAMLPSSTNANETANPELRGSEANRTKVFLNGIPLSNPVRNSQINGIGFFSLFNPELIKNMAVYPSNPPLIYGNTSAGSIDIETDDSLEGNSYQVSASLASAGLCISQKINKRSFIQVYGNHMFSNGFLAVNPEVTHTVKGFASNDMGWNYHHEISDQVSLNFYNYVVSESSDVLLNLYTWQDHAKASTVRDFSVINVKYNKSKNYISLNVGTNFSRSRFSFGNIRSAGRQQQVFISLNYKVLLSEKLSLQAGLSNEYGKFRFDNEIPVYYYAMSPGSPAVRVNTNIKSHLPEAYLYVRWKPVPQVIMGMGMRKNLNNLSAGSPDYLSLQSNIKYNFLKNNSLLLSVGKYNNITEPDYTSQEFKLLSADQVAIEYLYEAKNTNINLAAYYKRESGGKGGNRQISGFEVYVEQQISPALKACLSNSFLNTDVGFQGAYYNAEKDLGYFLVTTLSYFNPSLINVSVAWSNRQGRLFTPVSTAVYNAGVDFYQPVYTEDVHSERLSKYNTINLTVNKMIPFHRASLLVYVSIFNLLDSRNPKGVVYNKDYSVATLDLYQRRSVYFGCVWSF